MLGQLCLDGSRWDRLRLDRSQVLRLPVLRVCLTTGQGWGARRRLDRGARLLARSGVRRALAQRGFEGWPELERRGILPVEAAPLCRSLAAPLALAALERQGEDPARSAVTLRAGRVSRDMEQAARQLCPVVRDLFIDAGPSGHELASQLYWDYGAAVCPTGCSAAPVTLSFDGERPGPEDGCQLRLWGVSPKLAGLEIAAPELVVPEDLDPLPVLSAMWTSGRLRREELAVKIT